MIYGTNPAQRLRFHLVDWRPRTAHVPVRTDKGKKLGRLNLKTLRGMEGWRPPKDLLKIVQQLLREGRL